MSTCGPSRNSFMTGRRNDNLRSWNFVDDLRRRSSNVVTLPEWFKKQGYNTVSIGKVMHSYNRIKDDKPSWSRILLPSRGKNNEQDCPVNPRVKIPVAWCDCDRKRVKCMDTDIADAAIRVLKAQTASSKPLFLAVGFRRPHLDFIAPRGFPKFASSPYNNLPSMRTQPFFDRPEGMPNVAFHECDDAKQRLPFRLVNDTLKPWTVYPDSLYSKYRENYYRAVSYMDQQLGRVLAQVDSSKRLRNNTLIVFLSDNGRATGERNHFCKNGLFDVHNRVPLMIRLPESMAAEIPSSAWRGQVVTSEVELLDVFRTVTSLAKAGQPGCLAEGRDLTPFFLNPASAEAFRPIEELLYLEQFDLSNANLSHYSYAMSQMPRCNIQHGASDACTNQPSNEFQVMGYSLKTTKWRYNEWRTWNPAANDVDWSASGLTAVELYSHDNATVLAAHLPGLNFDEFENHNLYSELSNGTLVVRLGAILKWVVQTSNTMYPAHCRPVI